MSVTTLPDLASGYDIPPRQVAEFQRQGHTLLRRLASSEEAAAYRGVIRRRNAWRPSPGKHLSAAST